MQSMQYFIAVTMAVFQWRRAVWDYVLVWFYNYCHWSDHNYYYNNHTTTYDYYSSTQYEFLHRLCVTMCL